MLGRTRHRKKNKRNNPSAKRQWSDRVEEASIVIPARRISVKVRYKALSSTI